MGARAATARSIGEEMLGLFLHAPMAMNRRRLGRIRVLTMANSETVTKYRFLQSLSCGGSALLGSLINYRTRNCSAYGVGAIGVW